MRFHRWARDLVLAGATLRLFPDRWRLGAPSRYTHLALNRQAFEPLYSTTGTVAALSWLNGGTAGAGRGCRLGSHVDDGQRWRHGVILFSSRDPHHYQPGRGRSFYRGDRADAAGTAGTLD